MASLKDISPKKYFFILCALFSVEVIILGISPRHRLDWIIENILAVLLVILLAVTVKRFPMSRVSYTLMFLFLGFHQIGSHYTYSQVPYDDFLDWAFGFKLNEFMGWERNNFDRLVHFLYGFLFAYPIREVYLRVADARGFWGYFLPLNFTMSTSLIYEFIEWGIFLGFGGEIGKVHLGMQGDIWDAHKDMLMASTGALFAMIITASVNYSYQKGFTREWSKSLKIKHPKPLGEEVWFRKLRRRKKTQK